MITDAEIRALMESTQNKAIRRLCKVALNDGGTYLRASVVKDARMRVEGHLRLSAALGPHAADGVEIPSRHIPPPVHVQLASARLLQGRTIVKVELHPFADQDVSGKTLRTCYDPVLTLDNGARVWFVVEETDQGDAYGVRPVYQKERKR